MSLPLWPTASPILHRRFLPALGAFHVLLERTHGELDSLRVQLQRRQIELDWSHGRRHQQHDGLDVFLVVSLDGVVALVLRLRHVALHERHAEIARGES